MLPRRTKTPSRRPKTDPRPSKTVPRSKTCTTTNNQQPTTHIQHTKDTRQTNIQQTTYYRQQPTTNNQQPQQQHQQHQQQHQQQPDRPKTFDNYTNHIIPSKSIMTTRTGHPPKQKQRQARPAHQRHTVRWTQKTCTTILFHHVIINDQAPRFKNSTNDTSLSKQILATHNNYFSKRCNYMIP